MVDHLPDRDEILAWEAAPLRPARPPGVWAPRLGAALRNGFAAGFFPGLMVMTVYYLANRELDMPWLKIASLLAIYAPAVGILLAVGSEIVVLAIPHRVGIVLCAGLAGAVCGIAPGAFGVVVFGSYRGPFIGTWLIATSTISGAFLVAMPAALRARRAHRQALAAHAKRARPGDLRAVILATGGATVILGAAATVIAPLLVDGAFVRVQGAIDEFGLSVGGAVGSLGGAILGLYVGLVVALARSRRIS